MPFFLPILGILPGLLIVMKMIYVLLFCFLGHVIDFIPNLYISCDGLESDSMMFDLSYCIVIPLVVLMYNLWMKSRRKQRQSTGKGNAITTFYCIVMLRWNSKTEIVRCWLFYSIDTGSLSTHNSKMSFRCSICILHSSSLHTID